MKRKHEAQIKSYKALIDDYEKRASNSKREHEKQIQHYEMLMDDDFQSQCSYYEIQTAKMRKEHEKQIKRMISEQKLEIMRIVSYYYKPPPNKAPKKDFPYFKTAFVLGAIVIVLSKLKK